MKTVGKFEILGPLGRGSQSAVLLAKDPDLQRKVAIKLLRFEGASMERRSQMLREARAVGSLRHPNIVPVYEAGEHNGDPYLVFEYVEGQTLAQLLKARGALPPTEAAKLMVDVLDALDHAHDAGIVHRDLKPSNIIVTPAGQARVMDFGVSTRIGDAGTPGDGLVGTPSYMAPEYVARGEIGPQNDIFAAGLVLYEMLFGERAISGDGVFQILHRVANEPLILPVDGAERVGEQLLDIIAKATSRETSLRFSSAREMQSALQRYLKPGEAAEGGAPRKGSSTLEFLLRRMQHKSDFPAMSTAITTINRLAMSERADASSLSNAILKDLALTNKILRLANSAYYNTHGGGRVSTVSRAIIMLGFETVRNLAISLMLFDHIRDKQHADKLKDEFLRANLRALVAQSLSHSAAKPRMGEQAYICGLFHGLGRLLTHYYFREEAEMIDRLVETEKCTEDTAASRVLGMTYQSLGVGIAEIWGFPETIVHSMRQLRPGNVPPPNDEDDELRLLASCSAEFSKAIEQNPPRGDAATRQALVRRYANGLRLDDKILTAVAVEAADSLRELSRVLGIPPGQSSLSALLKEPSATADAKANDPLKPITEDGSTVIGNGGEHKSPETILASGIQDISQSLIDESAGSAELLCAIAEIIYRALGARRVLVCRRDAANTKLMRARYGFGENIEEALENMRFTIGGTDLFNLILAREVDVLVSDASAEKIRKHLPEWFYRNFSAQSFIVLPLRLQNQPVAMIYAESAAVNGIKISQEALGLLRTLRNQALLAIKQHG